jgi:hypothetical protein
MLSSGVQPRDWRRPLTEAALVLSRLQYLAQELKRRLTVDSDAEQLALTCPACFGERADDDGRRTATGRVVKHVCLDGNFAQRHIENRRQVPRSLVPPADLFLQRTDVDRAEADWAASSKLASAKAVDPLTVRFSPLNRVGPQADARLRSLAARRATRPPTIDEAPRPASAAATIPA